MPPQNRFRESKEWGKAGNPESFGPRNPESEREREKEGGGEREREWRWKVVASSMTQIQSLAMSLEEHLYASFEEESGFLQSATSITSNDVEEIQKFFDKAVDASCEGLVFITLTEDATYEPSEHSLNWLKLKKDYQDSVGDTLDLVPIGAFYGKGERKGIYGSFLLACYDKNRGELQTICTVDGNGN